MITVHEYVIRLLQLMSALLMQNDRRKGLHLSTNQDTSANVEPFVTYKKHNQFVKKKKTQLLF